MEGSCCEPQNLPTQRTAWSQDTQVERDRSHAAAGDRTGGSVRGQLERDRPLEGTDTHRIPSRGATAHPPPGGQGLAIATSCGAPLTSHLWSRALYWVGKHSLRILSQAEVSPSNSASSVIFYSHHPAVNLLSSEFELNVCSLEDPNL